MNKGGHENDKDRFQSVITAARGKSPAGTGLDISLCRDVQPCEGTVRKYYFYHIPLRVHTVIKIYCCCY